MLHSGLQKIKGKMLLKKLHLLVQMRKLRKSKGLRQRASKLFKSLIPIDLGI